MEDINKTPTFFFKRSDKKIKQWSSENNLKLNELKSGIIEFLPRLG